MPNYRYTAKYKTGREVTGTEETPDERALINLLRKKELIIISVKPQIKKEKVKINFFGAGGKIKLSELVLFSRQLATMIDSGIPLVQGLEMIGDQIEHPGFKRMILEVKKDVSTGLSFHEALAKHPKAFSSLFVNMVKAGESSGALDDIMDRLAMYIEKSDSLSRKVHSAMV